MNNIKLIINSYNYYKYKKLIDTKLQNSKSLIKEKIILNDDIKDIEKQLKQLTDTYIKKSRMTGYNNDNKNTYIKLCEIYDNIDDISDTLRRYFNKFSSF